MSPDEFLRKYESAACGHDLEAMMSMIDPEAEYWFSTGARHVGHDEIRRAIAHNFELIEQEDYRIHDLRWLVQSEGCAACTYRFEWSGKIHGQAMSGAGRGTCVLRRDEAGWRIVHEHLSKPAD